MNGMTAKHIETGPEFPKDAGLAWGDHSSWTRPQPSALCSMTVPSEETHITLNSVQILALCVLALCPGAQQ